MARVELPELRTSHAKFFRLDDGRLQVEASAKWPVHYLDSNGHWQDCDCTPRSDSRAAEYDLACRKTWSSVTRLAKRSPQPVRIERGGCKLAYRAQGVANVEGLVEGNRLSFADAWPDADLVWYVVPEGLRKEIILKSVAAPSSYSFLVEAQSLEVRRDEDGVVRAWAGPFPAFEVYRPYVHDAQGVPGPVAVSLRQEGGKTYLDLSLDPAWLSDPARAYPVTLDPTTVQPDATAGKDTYVSYSSSAANFGTGTALRAGYATVVNEYLRSLLYTDLSAYPAGFKQGLLQLYCYAEGSTTDYSVAAHRVAASWDEATVTWGTQPAHDATAIASTLITGTDLWFSWDITSLLNEWLNGTATGVKLIGNEATQYANKDFYSSDYATDPTLRPKYVLTLNNAPTVAPTSPTGTESAPGTVNNDVSPRLAWTYSDADSDPQAKYQVQVLDLLGNVLLDTGTVVSATAYHDCAADLLDYGKTYKWRVRVHDGLAWSAWSAWQYFQCVLTAPAGLTVTPNAAAARIDLSWTAHAGEGLAGYHVYRKLQGAADSTYVRLDLALVTGTAYVDDAAASGTAYTYAITAVASDGYESARSIRQNGTVTYSGYWVGSTQVKVRPVPEWEHVRRSSEKLTLTGTANVQDYGYGPKRVRLTLRYDTIAQRQALFDLFPAGQTVSYRDERGYVLRGKVSGNVDEAVLNIPGTTAYGWLTFTLTEVSA